MAVPSIPDPLPALIQLVKDAGTVAGQRVGKTERDAQGRYIDSARRPNCQIRFDPAGTLGPGSVTVDLRIQIVRVEVQSRANDWDTAWYLNNQVRDVFLPPPQIVEGLYGTFGDVVLFGTREDMPPRESPDVRNVPRVLVSYLIYCHRAGITP